jgi:hypothetical protein
MKATTSVPTHESSYQQKVSLKNMQIPCLDSQFILTSECYQASQCSVWTYCFLSKYQTPSPRSVICADTFAIYLIFFASVEPYHLFFLSGHS